MRTTEKIMIPKNVQPSDTTKQGPLYSLIADTVRTAIVNGSIDKGAVILEGPVAEILGCTRAPVRQALNQLAEEGLVSRFDGRGYAVGKQGVEPHRISLTADMLGLSATTEPVRKTLGWHAIYDEVERDIVHLSVFGRYRVNELELARHFGVGRTVARDVLLRIESLGLIEKDERLRWTITPLDDKRINHLYELRWLLEPAALRAAVRAGVSSQAFSMVADLRDAICRYPNIDASELDKLEHDLHVQLLLHCSNVDLLHSLQRTRCILTLSKHVLGTSAPMPERDPFMAEHLAVLEAVAHGESEMAESLLRSHLEHSCLKVTERAGVVRSSYVEPYLPYVTER
jgi:DNA-binding GntR family transcriptional regulator